MMSSNFTNFAALANMAESSNKMRKVYQVAILDSVSTLRNTQVKLIHNK